MRIYCATSNLRKLREFQQAGGGLTVEMQPGLEVIAPPEETGSTFAENAIIKALYYGKYTAGWLFAEDSGLEVEALQGAPGIRSARFAGENATDEDNNRLLLERLAGAFSRRARYVASIALVHHGELVKTFSGTVEGEILDAPRGEGGFGYDPLFYYPPFKATFAEVPLSEKQKVSHRARALAAMFAFLRDLEQPEPR
jgi:XTP/dITP diphosphohydrolase